MLEWPRLSEPAEEPLDGSELVNATDSNGPSHAVDQHLVALHFRTRPVGVPVLVVILRLLPDRAVCHLDERLALPTFPRPTDCVPHGRSMAGSSDRTGGPGFVRQSRANYAADEVAAGQPCGYGAGPGSPGLSSTGQRASLRSGPGDGEPV